MMRAVGRAERALVPAVVLLTVTHKCQLSCEHCYQAKHESDDLPTGDWIALMDELAQLGTLDLTFTGGEALLRKDLLTLIAEARKRSFAVTLFSNGGPITPAVARALKDLKVMSVEISIHSSHASIHDGFVGRQGAFAKAVRAVELLDDVGIPVMVKSNVLRCNAEEILELEKLFAARPRVIVASDVLLQGRDDGVATTRDRVSPEQMHSYFASRVANASESELLKQQKILLATPALEELESRPGCGAGRSFASVQPNGDVLACVHLPTMKMGNLREKRFSEMWFDSPPVRALRALTLQRFAECRGCSYRHVCAKCPALSLSEGGELEGHSKQICERTKAYWGAIEARLAGTPLARPESERQVGPFPVADVRPSGALDPTAAKRLPLRVVG